MTKADLTLSMSAVRRVKAEKSAPGLVAAIKSIAQTVPVGYWGRNQEGGIWTWNESKGRMTCSVFELRTGVRWDRQRRIDESTFTRYLANALMKGGILTIGDYAAVLDGTWYGLTTEQANAVGRRSGWPEFAKPTSDEMCSGTDLGVGPNSGNEF